MKDTSEQENACQVKISGSEVAQKKSTEPISKKSKTHPDYWKARLFKRSYQSNGQAIEIPEWQIRILYLGQRAFFNLGTPNQAAAATKARDIYLSLASVGWAATLAKYKHSEERVMRSEITVGSYLEAAAATRKLQPKTFMIYKHAMHSIVAQAFGVKDDKSKFDYRTGGNGKWRERVDSIRLQRIKPSVISKWQRAFVDRAGRSIIAIEAAERSANSYVRNARSLFTKKITDELKIELPKPLPFDGVKMFEEGDTKYRSKIEVGPIVAAAKSELKANDPESYKIFLLALFAGLRRHEIDLLEWDMLDFQGNLIKLANTEFLKLKTTDSAADITVDAEVMAELQAFKPKGKDRFVIASDQPARNDADWQYYRCHNIFQKLTQWLRSKGITANKPIHEMRKEIGAQIATGLGIYAASRFLRHSDVETTANHYADQKGRISVGLGKLLNTELKAMPDAASGA